jgi:integrase
MEAVRLRALRDRALLAVMFSSGGRRRSEISNLMFGQLVDLDPIPTDNEMWPDGLPSMGIRIGRTKTTDTRDDNTVFMTGRAVYAVKSWLSAADIVSGPVFLRIDRWGKLFDYSISAHSVNQVLKSRLSEIGEEPANFSAHGVRAGYISSAMKAGIPAPEIMEQTLHRSLDTLMGYFKDEQQRQGRAATLL